MSSRAEGTSSRGRRRWSSARDELGALNWEVHKEWRGALDEDAAAAAAADDDDDEEGKGELQDQNQGNKNKNKNKSGRWRH